MDELVLAGRVDELVLAGRVDEVLVTNSRRLVSERILRKWRRSSHTKT